MHYTVHSKYNSSMLYKEAFIAQSTSGQGKFTKGIQAAEQTHWGWPNHVNPMCKQGDRDGKAEIVNNICSVLR